tara:strand:+ start:5360 stop:7498 length:2139 start_codon:yes stop_codon:yes gene_type:complete
MVFSEQEHWPHANYNSQINNIVTEFFIPALQKSTTYQRIGGLFSSNSFALCARGIKELIANEGKMELIISPILNKDDALIIQNTTTSNLDEVVTRNILNELDSIESEFEKDHVDALRCLLKEDHLEIRVHIPRDENGHVLDKEKIIKENMSNEKIGIFQDRDGDVVSFRGPVNANRESWEKGTFSIAVDVSWPKDSKTAEHVANDIDRFEELWNDVDTYKLPELAKKQIIVNAPEKDEIHLEKYNVPKWAILPDDKTLWDNQIKAVNAWMNNNKQGIFTIATAGGKTLASLAASTQTPNDVLVLIVVHGLELVTQWEKEIKYFDPTAVPIVCDSKHDWRNKLGMVLPSFYNDTLTTEFKNKTYILVNDATASDDSENGGFLEFFKYVNPNKIMFIGDEVHHLGAEKYQKILQIQSKYRLGLSATFVRQWDEEGTQAIENYFGGELPDANYTVCDGIRDGRLCKYVYHIFIASLQQNEFNDYYQQTLDIGIISGKLKKDPTNKKLKQDLSAANTVRADIIKNASDKINAYKDLIKSRPILPYIVFLDDRKQLEKYRQEHHKLIDYINNSDMEKMNNNSFIFDGSTSTKDRKIILEQSVGHKTPIFSMYCLDEGIDVPEFQGAILVSSASSERQYIQRRGRILRGAIQGKIAELYDIIVIPTPEQVDDMEDLAMKIIKNELKRVEALSECSLNSSESKNKINDKFSSSGINFTF